MGGGGGASDIRTDANTLNNRIIVAGGGSGGAYAYKEVTTSTPISGSNTMTPDSTGSVSLNNGITYISSEIAGKRCRVRIVNNTENGVELNTYATFPPNTWEFYDFTSIEQLRVYMIEDNCSMEYEYYESRPMCFDVEKVS
jgi:hypothetical protein